MILLDNKASKYSILHYSFQNIKIKLKHFEEAFTSENWIVRIYRVKAPNNRNHFRMFNSKSTTKVKTSPLLAANKYKAKV